MAALKKAVGYVRCSTEMQEDSPDQQKNEILKFCEAQGYEILEWFVDFGFSGTTFDQRPGFQKLRRQVENKPRFKYVICYDESRWGRAIDPEENTFWRFYFKQRGLEVVLVKTSIDPRHEFAPMLKAFEGVQASQYSKKLSELTLRGAMANGIYSSGGFPPYGYTRKAINLRTNIERILQEGEWSVSGQEKVVWVLGEEHETEIVRFIFDERMKGNGYTYLAVLLNQKGVSCPRRGRWRNKDQKWSGITIKGIIENPAYYGARAYNRNSFSKILAEAAGLESKRFAKHPHWKNSPEKWVIVDGAHEAIVTREVWEKANSFKRPGGHKTQTRIFAPYLLSSLMTCSKCGFHYQGQMSGKKGFIYHRYICGGYNSKGVCDYNPIKRDPLELFVIQSIVSSFDRSLLPGLIRANLERLINLHPDAERKNSERLQAQIQDVESKLGHIRKALEEGASYRIFQSRTEELEKERDRLALLETENNQKLSQTVSMESSEDVIRMFMLNFEEKFAKSTIPEKREVIRKCVERIYVDHSQKVIQCFVRKIPIVNREVMDLYAFGDKNRLATFRSPVVTADVAGGGFEPSTYGL